MSDLPCLSPTPESAATGPQMVIATVTSNRVKHIVFDTHFAFTTLVSDPSCARLSAYLAYRWHDARPATDYGHIIR